MFALLLLMLAGPPALTREEAAAGWIQLFDGSTLFGWRAGEGAVWGAAAGALKTERGAPGMLWTEAAFGDFRLKLEYRVAAPDARGAVALREGPARSYEIVIDDVDGRFPTGSVAGRAKAKAPMPVAGRWRALDVTARGTRITVRLDGREVAAAQHFGAIHGAVGLKSGAGGGVEFRNVRLKPLDMACLFDAGNLEDWRVLEGAWSAAEREARAGAEAGALESRQMWDDFVLQADVRAGADLAFRAQLGAAGGGYALSALPARAAPQAGEWVTLTVAARGRQVNVWRDGYPVTSWSDTRPEPPARLRRGALRLSGRETAFRDLCIAPLRRR
jgi:hypothetical protein